MHACSLTSFLPAFTYLIYFSLAIYYHYKFNKLRQTFIPGRKTDVWYAIDLDTGIKQQTLKLDGTETVCPIMSNKKAPVFLGRTGT